MTLLRTVTWTIISTVTSFLSRGLWASTLVFVGITPSSAAAAVGGKFPLTLTFWPIPRHRFTLYLRSSDVSVIDVPQTVSGRQKCSTLTVDVTMCGEGSAKISVAVKPASRLSLTVQKIMQKIAALFRLGTAQSEFTIGSSPILVVAPHPDDEALMTSGIIGRALERGQPVKVIIVTNGDHREKDRQYGLRRQQESVEAMQRIGLQESDVIFLGYPGDIVGLLRMMNNYLSSDIAYTSTVGVNTTYGAHGMGHKDFHSWLSGKPATYNSPNLQGDLETLLRAWKPLHIYTTSRFDEHPDHRAVYYFVVRTVQRLRLEDSSYVPTLHTTIIHDNTAEPYSDFWEKTGLPPRRTVNFVGDNEWPYPIRSEENPEAIRFDASQFFNMPPNLIFTSLGWSEVESVPVPSSMCALVAEQNLKYQVLANYRSQQLAYLAPFCKQDEIFWTEQPPASELLISPPVSHRIEAGRASVLALTFICPVGAPRAVALSSSDEEVASVPPTIVVSTGEVTTLFAVKGMKTGTAEVYAYWDKQHTIANITVIDPAGSTSL